MQLELFAGSPQASLDFTGDPDLRRPGALVALREGLEVIDDHDEFSRRQGAMLGRKKKRDAIREPDSGEIQLGRAEVLQFDELVIISTRRIEHELGHRKRCR